MDITKRNRLAYLKGALNELQVIWCEGPTDDLANAIEDTRKEIDQLEPPCMQCSNPAETTHEGTPVCFHCLDHFMPSPEPSRDYTDSATANDMRFGTDID